MAIKKDYLAIDGSAIIIGDSKNILKKLPPNSVQCIITSPPYWGMRDYGIDGQIGLENEIDNYISNIVDVFNEARRVLRKDGTMWLNIGDCYTSGNRKYRAEDKKFPARAMNNRPDTPAGLKRKDLIGLPWKLAFALQADGWYLRSDIIWHKPNGMPESVKDRPYRNHEYLFLFSKSEKYYFDSTQLINKNGKRLRSVWEIPVKPNPIKHNAIFPEELVIPCLKASSKIDDFVLDPFFGSGTVGKVAENTNRKFVGIELNDNYAKVALERFQKEVLMLVTGKIKKIHTKTDLLAIKEA